MKYTESNYIRFGFCGEVSYDTQSEVSDGRVGDTEVDLSKVKFWISGDDRHKFYEALDKLIQDFHI